MTETSHEPSRAALAAVAIAVIALALSIGAMSVAVARGGDTTTRRLPVPMAGMPSTGMPNMGAQMGTMDMTTMDASAMREQCVSMMSSVIDASDVAAHCDSMVRLMTTHMASMNHGSMRSTTTTAP